MPAATATRRVTFLRHDLMRSAFLLAGLLATILGLLGMHVLAGSHGMHAQAATSGSTDTSTAAHSGGHGHDGHSVKPASVATAGTVVPPSCVCQGACAEKPAVHAGCTPSPAGASLSAPQPGSTFLDGGHWTAVRTDRPADYAYVPGTPTPRDLSISRT